MEYHKTSSVFSVQHVQVCKTWQGMSGPSTQAQAELSHWNSLNMTAGTTQSIKWQEDYSVQCTLW
eukprot:4876738-Prorocentrum_lima.AAC.1